jgi:type I restriction enzyme S subunit
MKRFISYKPTKHPYLESVPEHWSDIPLRRIITSKSVQNNDGEELLSVFLQYGVVRYTDTSQNQVHKPSENMSKYQLVEPRDVVLNNQQAWRGSVGVSKFRGIVSPAYFVYSLDKSVNADYMNYTIRDSATVAQFVVASKGVGSIQRNINPLALKYVVLPFPPREEQNQIVRFLDWKVSEINRFIRQKRREIALLTELMNTRVKEIVFSGRKQSVATQDSGIYWVGDIPAHWKTKVLFEVAAEQSNSNKTVQNQNLLSLSYGKIINKDINTTEGLLPASYDTYQVVDDGNIILRLTDLQNDKRSLRVGVATQTGIITSAYTCLKVRGDDLLPHYLYLLLHSYDICKVFYSMGGGVRQSIGYGEIKRMSLPIPPIDEQQEIIDYCYALRTNIEKMTSELKREIALIIEFRTRMISDVVTGKVDVRDIEVPEFAAEDIAEDTGDDGEIDKVSDEEVEDSAYD